ncbi:MAG: hypothetical protein WKF79_15695 [Nocardioides sp.]
MTDRAALPAAETWFLSNGLSYFVPSERAAAKESLRLRRTLPWLVVVVVAAGAAGFGLARLSGSRSAAPATMISLGVVAGLWYALSALRARRIVAWALGRTFGSLRLLVPMASRALPLLLVFVTFLFINAEAWQMTANLSAGSLWLTVVLLTGLALVFLLVRLPEEVDQVDDAVDDVFLLRSCAGTPLEDACHELVESPDDDPAAYAQVAGLDRWNLILVLLVVQIGQVLLLIVAVFVFFVLFGSLVMTQQVQEAFTGLGEGNLHSAPVLSSVSLELVKVSLFLAAFSGLYFTVAAVTDDTYRGQFFDAVTGELERAVGVRAVYLALRAREGAG